jgi:hypothetical protein
VNKPAPAYSLTSMRMRPTLLAVALLAAGLHAPDALALGLGAITTRSVIGEPLRAEIVLVGVPESRLGSECFSLDVPSFAGQDELPWLTRARIRMQGRSVFITGSSAVNEPILMVGLRIGCGFELARQYTILMQPAGVTAQSAPAEAAAPSASAAAPRATRNQALSPSGRNVGQDASEPAKPAARAPRKPRRSAGAVPRDRLYVAPGIDSGNGLKMSGGLAPRAEASEAQREALRTEQRLLAALDEQIATHLAIEDKVKQLEARLADLQRQLSRTERSLDAAGAPATRPPVAPDVSTGMPADSESPVDDPATGMSAPDGSGSAPAETPPAPTQAPGELTNEPVRVINKLPAEAQSTALPDGPDVNWLVAAFGALAAGSILGGTWLWRRRRPKVSAVSAVRRRHAEDAVASLTAERLAAAASPEEPESGPDTRGEFIGTPDVTEPAEPESAIASVTSIDYFPGEAPAEHMEDMEMVAPASARPPATESAQTIDFEFEDAASDGATAPLTKLDLEFDTFVGPASSVASPAPGVPANGPRLVGTIDAVAHGTAFNHVGTPANEENVPSHQHVLELAEIMMSFGRSEGAAQALSEFLRDYPKESLIPWLKLLELYHSSGRRGEYDDLAPKLNRAFNVKVPEWETFDAPSTTQESVEQFAHIMARINASWPNQDCLDYITELLRDNRAGTRIGFPLGVIDDLLLLRAMLEWLITNPSVTETQTTRLALL